MVTQRVSYARGEITASDIVNMSHYCAISVCRLKESKPRRYNVITDAGCKSLLTHFHLGICNILDNLREQFVKYLDSWHPQYRNFDIVNKFVVF